MKRVLPLGSIVYLHNSREKLMIISRGAVYGEDEGAESFYDYIAILYPTGFDRNKTLFFNDDDIDKVLFRGYSDEEEERIAKLYLDWREKTDIPQGKD